jgi:hypothetical protein
VEEIAALCRLIGIFGISAVVGIWKRPPSICKRLYNNKDNVTARGPVQLKDVLNLVDVSENAIPPPNALFTFNARGRKGIDFIFLPEQNCLHMTVRCRQFVVEAALPQLHELGIALPMEHRPLSDEELELLIRG